MCLEYRLFIEILQGIRRFHIHTVFPLPGQVQDQNLELRFQGGSRV